MRCECDLVDGILLGHEGNSSVRCLHITASHLEGPAINETAVRAPLVKHRGPGNVEGSWLVSTRPSFPTILCSLTMAGMDNHAQKHTEHHGHQARLKLKNIGHRHHQLLTCKQYQLTNTNSPPTFVRNQYQPAWQQRRASIRHSAPAANSSAPSAIARSERRRHCSWVRLGSSNAELWLKNT